MILDSSVIIDIARSKHVALPDTVAIPAIVKFEIIRGILTSKEKRGEFTIRDRQILEFVGTCPVIEMDNEIATLAAGLWASLKKKGIYIEDSDIIIAATALVHSKPLITSDKDFKHIQKVAKNLDIIFV